MGDCVFYKESVVTARQNQMLMTYASPTAFDNYPLVIPRRSLPSAVPSSACGRTLTVWVFIRQPVVLVAMQLVVRVPGVALVLSRVAVDVLALVPAAHLELVRGSHAGPASVGRSGEDAERGREKKGVGISFHGIGGGAGWYDKELRWLWFDFRHVSNLGLSQSRVRNFTPPPQVREHWPNSLHGPQFPSCFMMSGVSQMQ